MITLNWPDRVLSPNARCHWSVKAKAAKAYRRDAGWLAKASGDKIEVGRELVYVHVYFFPPDKRRRDLDGMLSSIKAGLDGIADALGVDDHSFCLTIEVCDPFKRGKVCIVVT